MLAWNSVAQSLIIYELENFRKIYETPWAYDVVSTSILVWNNIATSTTRYQRCFNVVLKTLYQRYRIDVVSTWNQGLFFDVNWQPKLNVVSTLFLERWINVVELTLFQRGIRVDFSSTSFNDVVTTSCNRRLNDLHFQRFYNVVSTDVWRRFNVVSTSFCPLGSLCSVFGKLFNFPSNMWGYIRIIGITICREGRMVVDICGKIL